jgi:transcription elongation factor GreA
MNGTERVFSIVGGAESNAREGKISNESPMGAALLGCKKGDKITVVGPTGRESSVEVLKIEH